MLLDKIVTQPKVDHPPGRM